jgi:hypothetical protein
MSSSKLRQVITPAVAATPSSQPSELSNFSSPSVGELSLLTGSKDSPIQTLPLGRTHEVLMSTSKSGAVVTSGTITALIAASPQDLSIAATPAKGLTEVPPTASTPVVLSGSKSTTVVRPHEVKALLSVAPTTQPTTQAMPSTITLQP